jgi:tetratricopeptide (TPR) repeat protein
MKSKLNILMEAGLIAGLMLCASGIEAARGSQYSQGSQSQPAPQQSDKPKTPEVTPLTLDAPAPVNAEEDAAFKAFLDVLPIDAKKKIELGEALLLKYPESRYRSPIYGTLAYQYLQLGDVPKMKEYGEKEIALAPNDVSTLALLGQTLPRSLHGNPADATQVLAKAEQYSKQAIEITPTLPKPAGLTDEAFTSAKNQTLAMAHSGLGLVYVRRQKYAEAIPELEQAVKIDPIPDPVNYYLLGVANKNTSHFDDAVAAFNKCASMPGAMQATCKSGAEDAKKAGATQLSAPK